MDLKKPALIKNLLPSLVKRFRTSSTVLKYYQNRKHVVQREICLFRNTNPYHFRKLMLICIHPLKFEMKIKMMLLCSVDLAENIWFEKIYRVSNCFLLQLFSPSLYWRMFPLKTWDKRLKQHRTSSWLLLILLSSSIAHCSNLSRSIFIPIITIGSVLYSSTRIVLENLETDI